MKEALARKLQEVPVGEYMNEAQQAFFKRSLESEMAEVRARIVEKAESLRTLEQEADEVDAASVEEQRQMTLRMLEHERGRLREITEALAAMKSGDYGYCFRTGAEIGLQRLVINPAALYCYESMQLIEAANKHIAR